jgi:pimeloyl-ACP methyl ester carboxylesterase
MFTRRRDLVHDRHEHRRHIHHADGDLLADPARQRDTSGRKNPADAFRAESVLTAAAFGAEGAPKVTELYSIGPARVQFQNKNPRGWAEFAAALAEHSSLGSALTMCGVQAARPSLYALTDELARVSVPVLVLVGDEDEGCLEPALMLKRTIPTAGLAVLPPTGHTANLEEPDVFNRAVDTFLSSVARGSWHARDPRSRSSSTTGMS